MQTKLANILPRIRFLRLISDVAIRIQEMTKDWKIFGTEVSLRLVLIILSFLVVVYTASSNWDWYTSNLDNTVKTPSWSNPTINWIIVSIWFIVLAFVWNLQHTKHPDQIRIDLIYPLSLILITVTFILFFEQRDIDSAKLAGVLSIICLGYLLYEAFQVDTLSASLLIINFGILLYVEAQIWYFSKNQIDFTKYCEDSNVVDY